MQFTFKVARIATDLVVRKADPFTLLEKSNGSVCLLKYKGPQYVTVNLTSKEMCSIEADEVKEEYLIHFPNYCETSKGVELWEKENCIEATKFKIRKPQIKIVNDYYYVYCAGHNLTQYGSTGPCSNEITKVSMDQNFSIDGEVYPFSELATLEHYEMTPVSNLINWKLLNVKPVVEEKPYDLGMLEELIAQHKTEINRDESWLSWIKRSLITFLLAVITICIILLIISKMFYTILYCIKKPVIAVNMVPDLNYQDSKTQSNPIAIPISSLY